MLDRLRHRHSLDLMVEECKVGPGGLRRLDLWVLVRTWSPVTFVGYEIKRTRGDFLSDQKMTAYLPYCHLLYLACPPNIIQPSEVPEGMGLLWATQGTRFVTKRKAPRREIDEHLTLRLMTYVLMSRTRIVADMHEANREDRASSLRRWVTNKQDRRELAELIGGRIGRDYREMQRQVQLARQSVERFEYIERQLLARGLDPRADWWAVQRALDQRTPDKQDAQRLRSAADTLLSVADRMNGDTHARPK